MTAQDKLALLKFAAEQAEASAYAAIQSAKLESLPYQRGDYISAAARHFRDAQLFAGRANMLELFDGAAAGAAEAGATALPGD